MPRPAAHRHRARIAGPAPTASLAVLWALGCAAALEPDADDGGPSATEDLLVGSAVGPPTGSPTAAPTGASPGTIPPGTGGQIAPPDPGGQAAQGGVIAPPVPDAGPAIPTQPPGEFTAEAQQLCALVNGYRQQRGLAPVALSRTLMRVAGAHVSDLTRHPEISRAPCNLHSWSNDGTWTPCCYTEDHAQAQCMWNKPRELGGGTYQGDGFEIAAFGDITPQQALELWQSSPPHHEVMLNAGIWTDPSPWPAMGCGLQGAYAVVWFGNQADAQAP